MTSQEWAVLSETPQAKARTLTIAIKDGWVYLVAGPCPFYDHGCTVYDVRPLNCRRAMCGRGDVRREAYEDVPVPMVIMRSRELRRQYQRNQAKAMRTWGRKHGWTE